MGRSHDLPRQAPQGPPPDDTGCTILHVDMDAFFASVEVRRNPELRGRPLVVGGTGGRGVVASASYEARRFGVRSAMPTAHARRLCPQAVFIQPDHGEYAETSRAVMAIFRDVTPLVEPLSLDEAFLDVTGAVRRLGPPAAIAAQIRARVEAEQRITCSVGVAPTKFVAKLASARCKPDNVLVVPVGGVLEFLHPLPVGALWGVGERTGEALRKFGLRTVGDLARTPLRTIQSVVGKAVGGHLYELSHGRDLRRVSTEDVDKSIGSEETFAVDVTDHVVIRRELLRLSEKVAARLRASGQAGRTVSIKVRYADFTTINRSRTLGAPTDVAREVYDTATALYTALGLDRPRIRLVGVRVEGLAEAGDAPHQLTFGERESGWREAEQAVDAAVRRFGSGAVRPATLVPGEGRTAESHGGPAGSASGEDADRELPATRAERQSRGRTDR
ncbi:MAG TPA: DNA polymerase IV [Mycobacteriales bacterium]|nr:DNA polymerase IV [Mycobacteriales bacterium]